MVIELGDSINPEINHKVRDLTIAIEEAKVPAVFDLVPSYRSLLVYYDPLTMSASEMRSTFEALLESLDEQVLDRPHVVHIPTLYGGA